MRIAVYCGSTPGGNEVFASSAYILGNWIGKHGHSLVYGGSNTGLMGAVADGTLDAGGSVTGVIPNVPLILSRKHERLTEYIFTETMAERKTKMIELADAFIALPGGIGTLDEITEIISLSSLNIIKAPIVFFNVNGYYEPIRALLENVVANSFGKPEFFDKIIFTSDVNDLEALHQND